MGEEALLTVIVSWTMSSWGTNPVIFLFQVLKQFHSKIGRVKARAKSTSE